MNDKLQYNVVISKGTMAASPAEALKIVLESLRSPVLEDGGPPAGATVEVFDDHEKWAVLEEEV